MDTNQLGMTALGTALTGIMPASLMDYIKAAEKRIADAKSSLDQWWNFIYGGNEGIMRTMDQSMHYDFDAENVAQLATYVAEVTKAIQNGEAVSQEDMDNLKAILQFVQDLDSVGVGENVTAGIAEGMTEAGWDTSAETLATSLESAISAALTGESLAPSGNTAMAGLAGALSSYDMSGMGSTISSNVKSALSGSLTATSLKSIGTNAMAGLKAGINAGRSGVVSAMQSATRAAVNAAKKELKIASPSRVFRDEQDIRSLAVEITTLTRRQQRGRGLRMA